MGAAIKIKPESRMEGTRLTYIGEAESSSGVRKCVFRCDCGKEVEKPLAWVRHLNTTSCGCARREAVAEKNKTHGAAKRDELTGAYRAWQAMKQRVAGHELYKDRHVSEEWATFENFYRDMGDRPEGYTLERIDNNKGYSKENCKWATRKEQARNRSTTVMFTHNGVTKPRADWLSEAGVSYGSYKSRKVKGWSEDKAILTPIAKGKSSNYGK